VILLCIPARVAGASPLADEVRARCTEILSSVTDKSSLRSAMGEMVALSDTLAGVAPRAQLDAIGVSEGYRGALELISVSGEDPAALAQAFAAHPEFAIELGLLYDIERDDLKKVAALAARLMRDRSEGVGSYPALGAALCVVHDRPYTRDINENQVRSPDPIEVFDYFTNNARRMQIDPGALPPRLLVHVVNVTETPEQMRWALGRYHNNANMGDRFFEIQYDTDHFRMNKPKKVTLAGDYRLESILQHGGVCADQAYFAESVSKACGVPSAYVRARGADVSHAWLGYMEMRGRRADWNFDSGRYPEYQKLRGNIHDPQTGLWVNDGRVGLLAGLVGVDDADRRAAIGAARVVERMSENAWRPRAELGFTARGLEREPRTDSIDDRLALLRDALTRCSNVPSAWELVARMTRSDAVDLEELDSWAKALEKMCGKQYPDFSFDILAEMIDSIEDSEDKIDMWEWAFTRYRARPDLASAVRAQQARILEEKGDKDNAWRAYEDIVNRFANDGPMVVTALENMRTMLTAAGMRENSIDYLRSALGKIEQPGNMSAAFARQSNFFRISMMLAEELEAAGRKGEADSIYNMLGVKG
jgi:hypothetical protein